MRNDCPSFQNRIADLVTGILPERDCRELEEHLASCADCRAYLQGLKQEDALLTEHFAGIDENMADRQERMLQRVRCSHLNEKRKRIFIWREIMRSPFSKFAAAAAVVLGIAVGIILLDQSATPAYAITDLPKALAQAQVVHVQGCLYFPERTARDGRKIPPAQINDWIDVKNCRSRQSWSGLSTDAQGNTTVTPGETIADGPYEMRINHKDRSVTFSRVSDYQQKLNAYEVSRLVTTQLLGQLLQVAGSTIVDHEQIEGVVYDIWQSEMPEPSATRYRLWVSAREGRLARAQALRRTPDGAWEPMLEFQTIEYNVPIPEGTFALVPPEGYTATNSPATAKPVEFTGRGGGAGHSDERYSLHCDPVISFALSDGSVILGWRSFDGNWKQDMFFQDLTLGGPLPRLPVEIYGLKPAGESSAVIYMGYHLGATHKDTRWTEWSLYVPSGTPSPKTRTPGYSVLYRFNLDPKPQWAPQMSVECGIPIETAADFDTWVRGAMAELSDNATPPADVTWQKVLDLARQIRDH